MKYLIPFSLCILMLFSCEISEGIGGRAAIQGKILVKDINQDGEVQDIYYAGEYSVYIIYGDNIVFDDDVETHFDGTFIFNYIYPGKYTVFAYSKCNTCPGEQDVVTREVIIEEKDELVELEDLVVYD